MIQVNEGNHNQYGRESEKDQESKRQPEFDKEQQGENSGDQFNQGISPGNDTITVAAFGFQQKKTDDRNIIIKTDRVMTVGTLGKRFNDGAFRRNAENAHIEKAADGGTENEGEKI
jgi:hypothetical protein